MSKIILLENILYIFESCDRFQLKDNARLGGGHHDRTLPRAPQGDNTVIKVMIKVKNVIKSIHILFILCTYFETNDS